MNLPAAFIKNVRSLLGDDVCETLLDALGQEPPVSLRLHPEKMKGALSSVSPVEWCRQGGYLDERLTFTFDPLFHAGCYYVQEASSMFVGRTLKRYVTQPVLMLDLCAAPGGKSTHACSVLPPGSLLVANEVVRNRSQILAENLTKWGYPNVVVTNNDPADFAGLGALFDVVLADVPCSGEGMFRKDAGAIDEWSEENVEICWQRQRKIISDVWPSLKPGGILLYSTCTYNTKEDEENVLWMQQELKAEPLEAATTDELRQWGITGSLLPNSDLPVCRFLPHKTKGEGFFLALLRKPETAETSSFDPLPTAGKRKNKKTSAPSSASKGLLTMAQSWIIDRDAYIVSSQENGQITAFPQRYADQLSALRQTLRVVQAGVVLGEVKGKDLIPAHSLAMSLLLRRECFAHEALSYEHAIAYLRKEAISLSETAPRGIVLLMYKNVPLGFVKNVGNRANNLYPQEWRIRSGYLPEEIRTLPF